MGATGLRTGGASWAARLDDHAELRVQTVTLSVLFARHALESVDLLKFDIEGAELDGGSDLAGGVPQPIALPSPPQPPLDHDGATGPEHCVGHLPLPRLDRAPSVAVEEVDPQLRHPLVGAEP